MSTPKVIEPQMVLEITAETHDWGQLEQVLPKSAFMVAFIAC